MQDLAIKNEILITGSIPERHGEKLYNTALAIDKKGVIIGKHRKLHLFDIDIPGKMTYKESNLFARGDKITVFDSEFGKIGLGICYDIRF